MIGSPEMPVFNPQAFDDSFLLSYQEQLADISVENQASAALADLLTIENADGTQKSYEKVRDETVTFFASEWVRNDETAMNRMAMEFAQACMGHNHGAELAQDGLLSSVFERGAESLFGNKHDDDDGHNHKDKDDDEIDPRTGKKKPKSKYSLYGSIPVLKLAA